MSRHEEYTVPWAREIEAGTCQAVSVIAAAVQFTKNISAHWYQTAARHMKTKELLEPDG